MSWICPVCGNNNQDELIRCVCGHEIREYQIASKGEQTFSERPPNQIFITEYHPNEIIEIINNQAEEFPTENIIGWFGLGRTSPVCGIVDEGGFVLRKNAYPWLSLMAKGRFKKIQNGTIIEISYLKPKFLYHFWGFLFNRYKYDRKIIIFFLKEWLKVKEIIEPAAVADH